MKKYSSFLLILVLLFMVSCSQAPKENAENKEPLDNNNKVQVVTTLFAQYDFAKQVGGDKVDVHLILPAGVEPHSYEPTPKDILKMKEADFLIYTGDNMEPWVPKIRDSLEKDGVIIIDVSKGIDLLKREHHDEHDTDTHHEEGHDEHGTDTHYEEGHDEHDTDAHHEEGHDEHGTDTHHEEGHDEHDTDTHHEEGHDEHDADTHHEEGHDEHGTDTHHEEGHDEHDTDTHHEEGHDEHDADTHHEEGHNHNDGDSDPHIWLDFDNAIKMTNTIKDAFVAHDVENKEYYENNAKAYIEKLNEIDHKYKESRATFKSNTIFTGGHFTFAYLAKRYDLEYESPYKGFSPNAEPSPKDIARLVDSLKGKNIKAIYYEELVNPKVAKVLSSEAKVDMLLLNGLHNVSKEDLEKGKTYIEFMEENLKNLEKGLGDE